MTPPSASSGPRDAARWFTFAPEVRAAFEARRPVVALESTIITHGMPRPTNVETARAVEAIIREHGVTPATIAVMDGRVQIGLTSEQLDALAADEGARKISRRDLAGALTQRWTGGTTVAATMLAAARAGIRVFATGGIGGVHRDGEVTMDISADLGEMAKTPVAVVCAGCKSILDIPRTLEVLESHGVPVVGFGCDELPAFYARHSGCPSPIRLDTPADVAALMTAQWDLGLRSGILVANPIPEADALEFGPVERAIAQARFEAKQRRITGKAVTPFLLERVDMLTGSKALPSNIALVKHNAQLAARIALEFHGSPDS